MTMAASLLLAQIGANAPRPGDWSFGWSSVGSVAAVSLGIIVVIWLAMRLAAARQQKIINSPWRLFLDLCSAHHLNLRERQLMTRLAQHFQLEHPAALFLESAWWESDRLNSAWVRCRPELDRLRKRLFAVR